MAMPERGGSEVDLINHTHLGLCQLINASVLLVVDKPSQKAWRPKEKGLRGFGERKFATAPLGGRLRFIEAGA